MEKNTSWYKPELWGGMECTINRIGNLYQDQLEYAGFYKRENDLEEFAKLGITSFRFPILWEKHQPQLNSEIDWSFAEKNLLKLESLKIKAIAGLLHHGSGPAFTSLEDPNFPVLFAKYAAKVAERFPFLEYYTPINEPLTTARFSGLYGLWYPHKKNDKSFARMMINQAKATVLAMMAIRKINPDAKLVQTEDLAKIYSTEKLKYQAAFENLRRWLTCDLLCGKVDPKHKLWKYFIRSGIEAHELNFFIANPYPPDILGCNYYVTSERFLDHEIEYYPKHSIGGNKRHRYADIEAVRVPHNEQSGIKVLVREAYDRFQIPIAITEVQLHCHREDQLRWFLQAWNNVIELKKEGVDVRAVTPWALLGAFGWNKLLTVPNGDYESGVFDVRSGVPRKTALYDLIASLNEEKKSKFHFLNDAGWWERDSRFISKSSQKNSEITFADRTGAPPLLIIGKRGTLGKAFARLCEARAVNYRLIGREDADITKVEDVERVIDRYKPWAVINAAGFVRVDDAERECDQCFASNTKGPLILATVCKQRGLQFVTYSTDLVFDGKKSQPYVESDAVAPLNAYGKSKAESESAVLNNYPDSLVIRTSAFFGPWDEYNFANQVLTSLEKGEPFYATDGYTVSPTYVPDLVHNTLDLLIDGEKNIWHISNNGAITWYDFARDVARRSGNSEQLIVRKPLETLDLPAVRPVYSVLKSEKGLDLPTFEDALGRFFSQRKPVLSAERHSSAA